MKAAILILALGAAAASSAMAGAFSGLCDTGLAAGCASNTPLTVNKADGNFTVTSGPAGVGTPFTLSFNPFSGAYFNSGGNPIGTASASWITAVTGTPPTDTQAVGTFNYQETITSNVTGLVTITGQYAADNCATIAWGGTPVTGTNVAIGGGVGASCTSTAFTPFNTLTSFSFQESVVNGMAYHLDFEVGNTGLVTGLLVDGLTANGGSTSNTPEPSSVLLTMTGFALLGGMIRRGRVGHRIRS
jgi:hypothetical protein